MKFSIINQKNTSLIIRLEDSAVRIVAAASSQACQTGIEVHGSKKFIKNVNNNG
jgi:hypothetical protein